MSNGMQNPGEYRGGGGDHPPRKGVIHTAEREDFDDDRPGRPSIGQSLEQQSELLGMVDNLIDELGGRIGPVLRDVEEKTAPMGGIRGGTSSVGDRLLSHNASIDELSAKLRGLIYRVDI